MIFDDFMIRALLAGLGFSLMAGTLGSFIIWKRMAFFGDTLAHSSLGGVALGLFFGFSPTLGILGVALLLSFFLGSLKGNTRLPKDTYLAILSHSALAAGFVFFSLLKGTQLDLFHYLFGDILAITSEDLLLLGMTLTVLALLFFFFWKDFLLITIHEDLAAIEGKNVKTLRFLLMLTIALAVATTVRIVGVLLLTSLLVIPAATSRRLSRSPEQMAFIATLLASLSVVGGLVISYFADSQTTPTITLSALILFLLTRAYPKQG